MESRVKTLSCNVPHKRPNLILIQYLESLMRLTYDHPELMKYIVYLMGASSVALLPSYFILPPMLSISTSIASMASAAGLGGLMFSGFNALAQHKVFGFPVDVDDKSVYQNKKFQHGKARARLVVKNGDMPILYISAKNHYDAGYAEGYILGEYIRKCLHRFNDLKNILLYFFEVPDSILETIPQRFQEEMQGKIAGYNRWLRAKHINEELTFKDYLMMQLLPDLMSNYQPLTKSFQFLLKPLSFFGLGCTTVAIRLRNYTAFLRLLDWPSHGMAGQYMLQVSRNISGSKRTIDVSVPVLSGALTVLNENALLIEMNVSSGNKDDKIRGMPALFFNRDCAENSASVDDVESFIKKKSPLVAYHLTATDGKKTKSFHLDQSRSSINKHTVDILPSSRTIPELLVVANEGVEYGNKGFKVTNHRDSRERSKNIHHFFSKNIQQFKYFIDKQKDSKDLEESDIHSLIELVLKTGDIDLVSNFATVFCGVYLYKNTDQGLVYASAKTDNLYAASAELKEFKQLRRL
jgi:hypothetical protein